MSPPMLRASGSVKLIDVLFSVPVGSIKFPGLFTAYVYTFGPSIYPLGSLCKNRPNTDAYCRARESYRSIVLNRRFPENKYGLSCTTGPTTEPNGSYSKRALAGTCPLELLSKRVERRISQWYHHS